MGALRASFAVIEPFSSSVYRAIHERFKRRAHIVDDNLSLKRRRRRRHTIKFGRVHWMALPVEHCRAACRRRRRRRRRWCRVSSNINTSLFFTILTKIVVDANTFQCWRKRWASFRRTAHTHSHWRPLSRQKSISRIAK